MLTFRQKVRAFWQGLRAVFGLPPPPSEPIAFSGRCECCSEWKQIRWQPTYCIDEYDMKPCEVAVCDECLSHWGQAGDQGGA